MTFDGLRYVVSWRSAAGSVLARVVPTTGAPSAVLSTLMTPAINRHSSVLAMNGGDGFVVTASNQVQAPIASARVTYNHFTESVTASPCTIELDCRTLSFVMGFCVPLDAGVDAGPGDAGLDAGLGDAGLGDAGLGDAGLDGEIGRAHV